MPTDKQSAEPQDFAQALTPVREAQAALVRAPSLSMGSAMEQAFAGLVGKLAAEPKVASFQPLAAKANPKPASATKVPAQPGKASGAAMAEQVATPGEPAQGVLAGLTQDLMAQAFAQAITEATRQGRASGQAPAAIQKGQASRSAQGSNHGMGALGQVSLGKAMSHAADSVITPKPSPSGQAKAQLGVDARAGAKADSRAGSKGEQVDTGAIRPTARPASMAAGEQAESIANPMGSGSPQADGAQGMVPTMGAWQALSGIEALVKELARLDAAGVAAPASRQSSAQDGSTASPGGSAGSGSGSRFPASFDVRAPGRSAAESVQTTDPSLLGAGQGARGTSNFDSVPSQGGGSGMLGSLEGLVSSVWAAMQEGVQQAGASKSSRPGGSLSPQRIGTGAGEQALSSSTASTGASARSAAPRSAPMLAPGGQRTAGSAAQQEATGGKVLAAVRIGESANDALNPVAPGAVPSASGNNAASLSDEALAEQLNRVLIEQAWRGGVDLS